MKNKENILENQLLQQLQKINEGEKEIDWFFFFWIFLNKHGKFYWMMDIMGKWNISSYFLTSKLDIKKREVKITTQTLTFVIPKTIFKLKNLFQWETT